MKEVIYKLFFYVLAILISNNAYSQDDSAKLDDMSLKELLNVKVTTASKTLQESDLAPASVVVVTKEQIKIRGYQSLLDLLIDLPDIKVDDKIYSVSRNSVTVRGIQGQQNFFIMLDGIKISSPTNEALPIMENYPLNLAEQVEIVYGPSSALYGADAVAGVINIITKKINGKNININASSIAGSYGYTNNTLYIAKSLGSNSDFVFSGQYCYDKQPDYSKVYKYDSFYNISSYKTGTFNTVYGPATPSTPIKPVYDASTMAYNFYAALRLDNFSFSVFSNYTRTPSAYGNNTSNAIYSKDVFIGQRVTAISASYKKTIGKITSTSWLIANKYVLEPGSNYRNLYTAMEPAYKYSISSSVKAEEQIEYKATNKLNVIAGASYEYFNTIPQSADLEEPVDINGKIGGTIVGTRSYYLPDGLQAAFYHIIYNNVGTYLQLQYALNKKLNFTIGARYDHNSRYGETFNPRAGIVYRASDKTTFKILYGSAYLAPAPTDAYVTYGSFYTTDSGKTYASSFLHLPNPGLKPITSQNFEINVRRYITDNLTATVDGYYTRLKGAHDFDDDNRSTKLYHNMYNGIPVDYIEVIVNEGTQHNYGGSISLNLKHSVGSIILNSYASFSYANGTIGDPDETDKQIEIPFISPFMFRIGTDIKVGKFSCSPRLLLMGRQRLPGYGDTTGAVIKRQTIAGYALLNLSARYEFSKRFAVFANATNLLNQRYRAVGYNMDLDNKNTELFYGQPQDPIRITGGLSLLFN